LFTLNVAIFMICCGPPLAACDLAGTFPRGVVVDVDLAVADEGTRDTERSSNRPAS
jgi:hypothetical protein